MHFTRSAIVAGLAVVPVTFAQTYTSCDPLNTTCPADAGLSASTFSTDFTSGAPSNSSWTPETGTTLTYSSTMGAEFTISEAGQAPTIATDFYIFFGTIEVVMQAAPGTGIVSSIVLESDDLDEIDWEFLGGDTTQAETNYFGKGNTTTYNRAIYYPVSSPQTTFHTYTVDWTPAYIKFYIDGTLERTLDYADANDGTNFPQTPMKLKLGNWAGGAAGNAAGTIEWAGGETDFSDGPFTMYVKSVTINNTNPAESYKYTDETGSFESIEIIQADGSTSYLDSDGTSTSTSTSTASSSSTSATKTSSASSTSSKSSSTSSTTGMSTSTGATSAKSSTSKASTTVRVNAVASSISTSSTAASSTSQSTTMNSAASTTGSSATHGSTSSGSSTTSSSSTSSGSSTANSSTSSTSATSTAYTGESSSMAANMLVSVAGIAIALLAM